LNLRIAHLGRYHRQRAPRSHAPYRCYPDRGWGAGRGHFWPV